ncbi:MAG: DUF1028 domain-containing protein [Gemmataceae bacterium]|nr:DUF1028 domain-containing protein [Gemmataceae bacterium]
MNSFFKMNSLAVILLPLLMLAGPFPGGPRIVGNEPPLGDIVATFSIAAHDPLAQEWGVAVASKYLAVGAVVPWAKPETGAVATQSMVNVLLGNQGLELMSKGKSPGQALEEMLQADPGREFRQVGLVDKDGNGGSYTGKKCNPWAGGKTGKNFACQGNLLAGPQVIDAMVKAFEETKGPLGYRLALSLDAGDKAGGDKRGKQSAALLVVKKNGGPSGMGDRFLDFRVDDHADPVPELIRIAGLTSRFKAGVKK